MRRFIHIVNRNEATWSAFGAVAALQRSSSAEHDSHDVLILGSPGAFDRAEAAGLRQSLHSIPRGKTPHLMIAWDEAAAAWCSRKRLECATPDQPIPIQIERIKNAQGAEIRRRMQISDGARVAVSYTADTNINAQEHTFVRAAALGLAGLEAVWLTLDAPPIQTPFEEALARTNNTVRVLAPAAPPWTMLAIADLVLIEASEETDVHAADFERWANAAGVPTIVAPVNSDASKRDVRFETARRVFDALQTPAPRRPAPFAPTQQFERYLTEQLERASVQVAN